MHIERTEKQSRAGSGYILRAAAICWAARLCCSPSSAALISSFQAGDSSWHLGTLAVGNRAITTNGDFLTVEIAFTGMTWYKLDPQKMIVMTAVMNPDLGKIDEVGLASLAPGGGHGIAGSFNLSTVELFAKGVPR